MQRRDQALDVGFRDAQNVKRQTLRRLLPDTRQAFEFVDKFGDGFSVIEHCEMRIAKLELRIAT